MSFSFSFFFVFCKVPNVIQVYKYNIKYINTWVSTQVHIQALYTVWGQNQVVVIVVPSICVACKEKPKLAIKKSLILTLKRITKNESKVSPSPYFKSITRLIIT